MDTMPIHKNAFQNCNFDKNLFQKKFIIVAGKGLTKN